MGGVCSIHSSLNQRSMAGMESRTLCSSSLMGPFKAVTKCGTIGAFYVLISNFTVAQHHVLERSESLNTNRSTGMKLIGRDANFCT